MRHPTVRFPDYPPLVAPPEVRSALLPVLSEPIALTDLHDPYNGFMVAGAERWGRPARFRLSKIRASRVPFEGVPAEETRFASVHLSPGCARVQDGPELSGPGRVRYGEAGLGAGASR